MKLVTLKSLVIALLSIGISWVCTGNSLQAKEKPQEAMDRIRTFSIDILEKAFRDYENIGFQSFATHARAGNCDSHQKARI